MIDVIVIYSAEIFEHFLNWFAGACFDFSFLSSSVLELLCTRS